MSLSSATMNKIQVLKRLLPGFLPIIVFIVVDELWGTLYGLCIAIAIGIIELLIGYIKDQKIDRFIFVDVGLLVALGAISIALDNELFFKLKPGVIGLLMTSMIGFSAYSKHNLLLQMTQRYMKGTEMNPYQVWMMISSMKRIFWVLLVYSLITLASSFVPNKAFWAFMGGPGLFVIMGAYLAMEWLYKKEKNKQAQLEEWLPLVDENGQVKGTAPRSVVHNKSFLLHPVVHLHVFYNNKILLQKRAKHKQIQPGKWDTAVGGHVAAGQTIEQALQREAAEEIGLKNFQIQSLDQYLWSSEVEKELVFVFSTKHKGPFKIDNAELDEIRFWSLDEIQSNLGQGIFTPNFEHEFEKLGLHADLL